MPQVRAARPGRPFNELADEFLALAKSGAVAQKGGRPYAKGSLDTYRRMYDNHGRADIGKRDARKITVRDWQLWVDGLNCKGLKRNSIGVTLNCVRAIYRWACGPTRTILAVSYTHLTLPTTPFV